jgi:hypothetical protein
VLLPRSKIGALIIVGMTVVYTTGNDIALRDFIYYIEFITIDDIV